MNAAMNAIEIHVLFEGLAIGTRFFPAYSHQVHIKVSATEVARYSSCKNLYSLPMRPEASCSLYSEDHPYRRPADISDFNILPLASIANGVLLGHVRVFEGVVHRQNYEVAAWFRDHEIVPGIYPVFAKGLGSYGVPMYSAEFPTIIKDACLKSMFGGVCYGQDYAGNREIGTTCSVVLGNSSYDHMENLLPFQGKAGFEFIPLLN